MASRKRAHEDFTRARRELEAVRDQAPKAVERARQKIGPIARGRVAEVWPIDTGRSKRAWKWDGKSLINPVEYSEFVHDELYKRLIPKVFQELRPLFDFLVAEEIRKLARSAARAE